MQQTTIRPSKIYTRSSSMFFIVIVNVVQCFSLSYFFGHVDPLAPIWVHLGCLWGPIGPSWVLPGILQGSLGLILSSPWGHLGPSWTHLGLTLGSSWPLLAPSCSSLAHLPPIVVLQGPFGTIWGSFLYHVAIMLGSLGRLGIILESFLDHFILVSFSLKLTKACNPKH